MRQRRASDASSDDSWSLIGDDHAPNADDLEHHTSDDEELEDQENVEPIVELPVSENEEDSDDDVEKEEEEEERSLMTDITQYSSSEGDYESDEEEEEKEVRNWWSAEVEDNNGDDVANQQREQREDEGFLMTLLSPILDPSSTRDQLIIAPRAKEILSHVLTMAFFGLVVVMQTMLLKYYLDRSTFALRRSAMSFDHFDRDDEPSLQRWEIARRVREEQSRRAFVDEFVRLVRLARNDTDMMKSATTKSVSKIQPKLPIFCWEVDNRTLEITPVQSLQKVTFEGPLPPVDVCYPRKSKKNRLPNYYRRPVFHPRPTFYKKPVPKPSSSKALAPYHNPRGTRKLARFPKKKEENKIDTKRASLSMRSVSRAVERQCDGKQQMRYRKLQISHKSPLPCVMPRSKPSIYSTISSIWKPSIDWSFRRGKQRATLRNMRG